MSTELASVPLPTRAGRALATAAWDLAPALLWRALHPLAREPWVAGRALPPLERVPCTTEDGWRLPLHVLPPGPGGAGEPVLLLPTLGVTADVFRCGGEPHLAGRLARAGFRVFLGGHRAGREALPPPGGAATFDEAARLDVRALLAAAAARSGYPRVHVVGHGLGGQLALAAAAITGGEVLASLAVCSAPVRFPAQPRGLRRVAGVARHLPRRWRLPSREAARWGATLIVPDRSEPGRGARRRAALVQAGDDVPLSVLAVVEAWLHAGALVDLDGTRDYALGLARVGEPLWVAAGDGDRWCPGPCALAVRDAWRAGPVTEHVLPDAFDHLDAVLHPDADEAVHQPLVDWLVGHRARAWREPGVPLGLGARGDAARPW